MFCCYSNRRHYLRGHVQQGLHSFGLDGWLSVETGFSIVFTGFSFVLGKIQASKRKHHFVKCSVVLSALLSEWSDGDAEGCCFQVLFHILQTVTDIFGNVHLEKTKEWNLKLGA